MIICYPSWSKFSCVCMLKLIKVNIFLISVILRETKWDFGLVFFLLFASQLIADTDLGLPLVSAVFLLFLFWEFFIVFIMNNKCKYLKCIKVCVCVHPHVYAYVYKWMYTCCIYSEQVLCITVCKKLARIFCDTHETTHKLVFSPVTVLPPIYCTDMNRICSWEPGWSEWWLCLRRLLHFTATVSIVSCSSMMNFKK